MLIRRLHCQLRDMIMANGPNLGQKRRPRKRSKKRRSKGNQKVLMLSLVAVAVVVSLFF